MRVRRRLSHDRATTLRAIPLFRACTDAELREVDRLVDAIEAAPGEVLASERDVTGDSYVIVSGEVGVVVRDRSVERLGPGDVFGDLAALVPRRPLSATVTAITPLRVLVVEKRNLVAFVAIPSVGQQLAMAAVARLDSERRMSCR